MTSLRQACPDCGCRDAHFCVGRGLPNFFGSKIEIDPSLPVGGWYLKAEK